jgi:hypothetical protein
MLILLTGCRGARMQDSELYARLSRIGHRPGERGMDELAKEGAVAVVTECGKTSFANVRTGLIIGETKLHEDVFEMRNRVSFRAVFYGLDDTLQLEEMLNAEASAGRHSDKQARCMQSFAEHLKSLTDPIVEGDRLQREIDLSAFNRATKQSEEENQREFDSLPLPNAPAAPTPTQ